ncbi:unnamed protein product [Aphanomyces euteiches]|uniref:HSF-type DNA-binding domain-containing protein n=1 Tax=Aphanomyces euteiches TaxID=100861 RepID=A0A6G0XA63_9STRA|nr:hypothetical protein Ae201684_007010 [Aphanomyces euteiches]KAH9087399.1 hypothetical protein Ae201684P_000810 [Aphanomyces euteiches]KAH9133396.1 hypothetical protein AeRB84_020531 [Aphanomyces euteiches]
MSPRRVPTTIISTAAPPFLASLYDILSKENPRVIAWCDGGRAFAIYDYDEMERRILPTYFRHHKFASFQRQLNYFGFRKLQKTHGSDHVSIYCQPLFLRDDPSRMLLIKRKTYGLKTPPSTPRTPVFSFPTYPSFPTSSMAPPTFSRSVSEPITYSTNAPSLSRVNSAPATQNFVDIDAYLASMHPGTTHNYVQSPICAIQSSFESFNVQDSPTITLSLGAQFQDELAPIPFRSVCDEDVLRFSDDELDLISSFAHVEPQSV